MDSLVKPNRRQVSVFIRDPTISVAKRGKEYVGFAKNKPYILKKTATWKDQALAVLQKVFQQQIYPLTVQGISHAARSITLSSFNSS